MNSLSFAGTNLSAYGVHISGSGTYNAPVRSISQEVVPGRNGVLILDNGRYENIDVTYPAFIVENFSVNMRSLRDFLGSIRGYARLEDTYHPDDYCLACFQGGIDVDAGPLNKHGEFDLTFNRKPQRFLKSGETATEFTATGSISNPTMFNALPLIRIYGTGTVGIGNTNITFDGSTSYVDIDCELQDAYYGSTNKNASITLSPYDFPVLKPGSNGITLGTGITKVVITPRWWHL